MVNSGMMSHDMVETEEIQECTVGRKEHGYGLHGSEGCYSCELLAIVQEH
jgi:hypothetical protein